jgi:sterol desaturase/sphingolipid hydroxylase (fatty acid hydroxylase superfamily)
VLVLGTPWANIFTAGFLTGYLMYDMTYYHVHHHRPRTALGKLVRELHMRHHFQDDSSCPFWDYVFGTPQRGGAQTTNNQNKGGSKYSSSSLSSQDSKLS